MREYVRDRKHALGLHGRVTCVPQSYAWGAEAQVDWYEAVAELDGVRQTLQVFGLRSMASGGAFHRAYTHATQQAFLEAHEAAFAYFGGVFHRLRYDNLPLAVKRILRGREREQTTRFIAFRSHWRFAAEFCTPGEGHEKGGVEGEAGYFRRNHWVPIPQAPDLAALNAQLRTACEADWHRMIAGRAQPVGPLMQLEQPHLLPLAAEGFALAEVSFPRVDGLGRVKVRTNAYSVPVRVGTQVEARVYPTAVEVWHAGHCLARHARCYGRQQEVLDLEHYLDVLVHKPGALAGATPLAQWRAQGRWPASYDTLWAQLQQRQGRQAGTRAMITVLQLGRVHGEARLHACVAQALAWGCADPAAVRYLLTAGDLMHAGEAVPRVAADTPMKDVIYEMSRKGLGITTVQDGDGRLLGVITDGDLRRLMEADPDPLAHRAAEVMHPGGVTIAPGTLATGALRLLETRRITSLIVAGPDGRVAGMVHIHDLWGVGLF